MSASVIVPNFNGEAFLPATLASLAQQDVPGLDVIIVDGGSTDGSVEMIASWAEEHGARWVSEPDEGQAQAINKGFRIALGDIVAWLNSDDLYPPGAVARAAEEFARDPELEFLWGFCLYIDPSGTPLHIGNPYVHPDLAELRGRRNFVMQPGSWFRRSVFERFGYLDETYQYALDYEYFLRLAGRAHARFIPEIMAHFRVHPTSKTSTLSSLSIREQWRAHRQHGGRILSPFTLDMARNRFLIPALATATRPARALLWRAIGLRPGTRIRP